MIGERLKEQRLAHRMTQRELADYLGLTSKMISFYELGQRNPPNDVIVKLSKKFGVSADYLLGSDTTEKDQGYYHDPEVAEMVEQLRTQPGRRILFDASKDLTKEDIDFVLEMIDRIKKKD